MFKRLISAIISTGMLGLAVFIAFAGIVTYRNITVSEDPGAFKFNREQRLNVVAKPLISQVATPQIETFGAVQAASAQALTFELAGIIEQLSDVARNGGQARKGDVLARLKVNDNRDAVRTSALAVEESIVRLNQLLDQQESTRKELVDLERSMELETEQFQGKQQLAERDLYAKNALAQDEQNLITLRMQRDSKAKALNDLEDQIRLAEITQELAEISESAAANDFNALTLTAPKDGFVLPSPVSEGQTITQTTPIITFAAADEIDVQFRVPFSDYGRLLNHEDVSGNPDRLLGRDVTMRWAIGPKELTYKAKLIRVERAALTEAASVRMAARLNPVSFTDPLVLGAQVEIVLAEAPVSDVYLVDEQAISTEGKVFAVSKDTLRATDVSLIGYLGEQAIVRGDFADAAAYVTVRTRQMYNGAKVRVSNPEELRAKPKSAEVARQDSSADAPNRSTSQTTAPASTGNQQASASQSSGTAAQSADGEDLVTLEPEQQKALIARVKRSPMPDNVKQRIIPMIESGKVPARLIERLTRGRRG